MPDTTGAREALGFREKAQAFLIALAMVVLSKIPTGDSTLLSFPSCQASCSENNLDCMGSMLCSRFSCFDANSMW